MHFYSSLIQLSSFMCVCVCVIYYTFILSITSFFYPLFFFYITKDLSWNRLTGHMPNALSNLNNRGSTIEVDLSHNTLTGSIPRDMFQINGLVKLRLSHNLLSGSIPDFSNARALNQVTLSLSSSRGELLTR